MISLERERILNQMFFAEQQEEVTYVHVWQRINKTAFLSFLYTGAQTPSLCVCKQFLH